MDHGLVPNTHIGWLTAVYNSSSGKSNSLFKPPWAPKRYHSWFQIFMWVKYVNCLCSGASVWGRAINELICQTGTCALMGSGTGWEKWILMEGSRKWLYNRSPGHSSQQMSILALFGLTGLIASIDSLNIQTSVYVAVSHLHFSYMPCESLETDMLCPTFT